jgi:methylglutaconyl-CoA hydratase
VRLIVLASEGPVFSSGSNVAEFARKDYEELSLDYQELMLLYESFFQSSKPTIARVHGDAFGGALGLIAACDVVLAAESARFAFSEVRLGFAPTLAAVPVLRRVRPADARELFLTGRKFDARHAASIGLVNKCVADDDLDDEVDRVVRDICRGGPRALTIARSIVQSASSLPSDIAYDHVLQFTREFVASKESQEGVQAFLEGRSPSW